MNVLVYAGPQTVQASLNQTLSVLRTLLAPHYSVQPLSQQALVSQPWRPSCSLLVFPRCHTTISPPANLIIQEYVDGGGAYLGLGFGARYGDGMRGLRLDANILNPSKDLLRFYVNSTNSYLYPSASANDMAPTAVELQVGDGSVVRGICKFGDDEIIGFDHGSKASILATYVCDGTNSKVAGIRCDVGRGQVALWSPSIEEPVSPLAQLAPEKVKEYEERRLSLVKDTLESLGLQVPSAEGHATSHPLPQFLTSDPSMPSIVPKLLDSLAIAVHESQPVEFDDVNDKFCFCSFSSSEDIMHQARSPAVVEEKPTRFVIVCLNGELPNHDQTPSFDLRAYYDALSHARSKHEFHNASNSWSIGNVLLYGEVVTSTQSMLDKNPRLLSALPAPILSLASHQLAGRGRGTNVWLSPSGCLQFSLLLRVSLSDFPASKLVFIQYLFALAVVEACRDDGILGKSGERVRLKWPNDLYALVGDLKEERKKIGGILVNTSFSGNSVDIVIGCGLNVLNPPPITSLAQLASGSRSISMERTAAIIMARFEPMWDLFVKERGSFEPFIKSYLDRWLHSDQLVTLTATTPPSLVRIAGITLDHGLLRTVSADKGQLSEGQFIDLQPDGNSFDLMTGLIKTKS
ncbi:hypothetical protein AX17_001625 [Amanita inopinata Kibby_2008]|nr:hypothetical protein AX17_001625 [Amanita inopinata Kibby_2008]